MPILIPKDGAVPSDSELIELYKSGNESVFTEIVNRYGGLIRSVTSKYRVSGLDPDDLTQEGVYGLMSAVKSYDANGGASFKTFASVCIERRVISLLKRSTGSKNRALSDYVSIDDENVKMISGGVNPEDELIAKENVSALESAIEELLSEKERRVLSLYLAGESYADISQKLDMPKKSVDNAMQRIRRKLKNHISGNTP